MTKKQYYRMIDEITKTCMNRCVELEKQAQALEAINLDVKKYASDYRRQKFNEALEIRHSIKKAREEAEAEVRKISSGYAKEIRSRLNLNPDDITEDVKLLDVRFNLKGKDIEAMLQHPNNQNATMCRMIRDFAKQNGIEYNPYSAPVFGEEQLARSVEIDVPFAVSRVLKCAGEGLGDSLYSKIIGEGSAVANAFNCEE